jgi:membrane-associated PAP2 superfamily phosphatase
MATSSPEGDFSKLIHYLKETLKIISLAAGIGMLVLRGIYSAPAVIVRHVLAVLVVALIMAVATYVAYVAAHAE